LSTSLAAGSSRVLQHIVTYGDTRGGGEDGKLVTIFTVRRSEIGSNESVA